MNQSSVVELLFGIWVPPFYRGFLFQTKQFPQSGFSTPVESGGYMETRLLDKMPGKRDPRSFINETLFSNTLLNRDNSCHSAKLRTHFPTLWEYIYHNDLARYMGVRNRGGRGWGCSCTQPLQNLNLPILGQLENVVPSRLLISATTQEQIWFGKIV